MSYDGQYINPPRSSKMSDMITGVRWGALFAFAIVVVVAVTAAAIG